MRSCAALYTVVSVWASTTSSVRGVRLHPQEVKINARAVEKALQVLNQSLPLGCRLWRCPDKGSKFDKEIDGHLHKVFITVSPHIGDMVAKGEIMINE